MRRSSPSISGQGAKQRSQETPSIRLKTPVRIFMPRLDMPISYVSGKQKHIRVRAFSLSVSPNSPPVYLPGFSTRHSSFSYLSVFIGFLPIFF